MGPLAVARETIRTKGITGLYSGLSTLVVGTFVKNAVRFAAFNQFRNMLLDENGKLPATRSAIVCWFLLASHVAVSECINACSRERT